MSSTQAQTQRQQTSVSTSPRRTFSDRISAVGAKINRALSSDAGRSGYNAETESITSTIVEGNDRSNSRGRNNFHSSGRGGAGNIHATPNNPALNAEPPQDFPWPRGRERAPVARAAPPSAVRSTGRGGSGNFSQSPPAADPSYSLRDREILRAHAEADKTAIRSSGRGGIGNIVTSHTAPVPTPYAYTSDSGAATRSRSRSIDPIGSPASLNGYSPSPPRRNGNGAVDGNGHGRGGP
ncbi:hypothetical protein K438DRAFT_1969272 [Mycena galopus ATCC 62051]|nr:hypothetical protein K438DRAFT_1969272 [Mycena galopus ATCC 62051]